MSKKPFIRLFSSPNFTMASNFSAMAVSRLLGRVQDRLGGAEGEQYRATLLAIHRHGDTMICIKGQFLPLYA